MNLPITIDSNDFVLQSLVIGSRVPKKTGYILLIKWYRCGHCIVYMPIFEQFATKYPDIGFLVLESSTSTALLQQWSELQRPAFKIDGYPTVVLFNGDGNPMHIIENRNDLDIEIMKLRL